MDKKLVYEGLLEEEKDILKELEGIRRSLGYLKNKYNFNDIDDSLKDKQKSKVPKPPPQIPNTIPRETSTSFNVNAKYSEKVLWLIQDLEEGMSNDVKERWMGLENVSEEVALRESKRHLSILAKNGIIGSKRSGKGNSFIYFVR